MAKQDLLGRWKDPLRREIVLEMSCWKGHILRHHPDMALRLEEIGKALEDPDVIRKQGNERLYYRKDPDQLGNEHLKVTVRLHPNPYEADGFVATAYPLRVMEQRGEVEWRKN